MSFQGSSWHCWHQGRGVLVSPTDTSVLVLFCVVLRCAFGPLRVAPVNAFQLASGMVPSLFLASPQRGCHCQTVQGIHYCLTVSTNVCVLRWLGSVPSFPPCPYHPDKDAFTQSLATVARAPLPGFVRGRQMAISDKS